MTNYEKHDPFIGLLRLPRWSVRGELIFRNRVKRGFAMRSCNSYIKAVEQVFETSISCLYEFEKGSASRRPRLRVLLGDLKVEATQEVLERLRSMWPHGVPYLEEFDRTKVPQNVNYLQVLRAKDGAEVDLPLRGPWKQRASVLLAKWEDKLA